MSAPVCLRWGLRTRISDKSQVMLVLPAREPHFENQSPSCGVSTFFLGKGQGVNAVSFVDQEIKSKALSSSSYNHSKGHLLNT